MKKSYQAPKLNSHGTVSKLTASSGEFGFQDLFFGRPGTEPTKGNGTLNACIQVNGQCLDPNAKGKGID
ncbi:MAG: putative RiPP precursor [Hapalosiphonaceae cyanobacterium JJU2]|nr:MAG: putative RiPP precursor [Hapalosiphonaceae cyanobacterium JJU2]